MKAPKLYHVTRGCRNIARNITKYDIISILLADDLEDARKKAKEYGYTFTPDL